MAIELYYKGLSIEDRLYGQTPENSAKKAKGTLYEAWFDVLQTSPWYRGIAETGEFPSLESQETWSHFGDLKDKSFSKWWLDTGYRIFAERVPYQPIQVSELSFKVTPNKNDDAPPVLTIEIPLNLSPAALREQFMKILEKQESYQSEFKRWEHSTAPVHQYRETKLNYATIQKWINVYREYEKRKDSEEFKLYNFAKELDLHPTLFRGLIKKGEVPEDLRVDAANVASDFLKSAKNLMANATEGRFPCTDSHPWASSGTRVRRL